MVLKALSLSLIAVVTSVGIAFAQDVTGIGRNTPDSPVLLAEVRGAEGGFFEPEGLRINAYVYNVSDKEVHAFEVLVLGLNPWNVTRTVSSIVRVKRMDPGQSAEEGIRYPYLGKRDILTLIGVVTRVRFADGSIWVASDDEVKATLLEGMAGLDLSGVPLPTASFRLDGHAGAYSFTEMQLSPGWDGPLVEGGCAAYEAQAEGGLALQLVGGRSEYLRSIPGDKLIVCGQVVHVIPAGTSPAGPIRGGHL